MYSLWYADWSKTFFMTFCCMGKLEFLEDAPITQYGKHAILAFPTPTWNAFCLEKIHWQVREGLNSQFRFSFKCILYAYIVVILRFLPSGMITVWYQIEKSLCIKHRCTMSSIAMGSSGWNQLSFIKRCRPYFSLKPYSSPVELSPLN